MRNDPAKLTRLEQARLTTVREVHVRQQALDDLVRPVVERAMAEAGDDLAAAAALAQHWCEQRDDIRQALISLEVAKIIRDQVLHAPAVPTDGSGQNLNQPRHE